MVNTDPDNTARWLGRQQRLAQLGVSGATSDKQDNYSNHQQPAEDEDESHAAETYHTYHNIPSQSSKAPHKLSTTQNMAATAFTQ